MSQEDRASAPKRTRAVVGQDTIAASKGRFRGGHEREATSRPSLSELRNSMIDADFKEQEAHIVVLEAQLEISMSQAGAHGKVSLDVNHSTNVTFRPVLFDSTAEGSSHSSTFSDETRAHASRAQNRTRKTKSLGEGISGLYQVR
jgi:hypothetical protein